LANGLSVNAIGDDQSAARQLGSPFLYIIGRAVERVGNKRVGTGKVGLAPHIDDDRRSIGTQPRVQFIG
jgi:hypothetical protein